MQPDSTIDSTVATKVNDCVTISEPLCILKLAIATLKAAVPEDTAKEYLELNFSENFFSNFSVKKLLFLKFSKPCLKRTPLDF